MAKPVVKVAKSKKAIEMKKKPVINMMYNNLLADPACLSAVLKSSMTVNAIEALRKTSSTGSYVELMKPPAPPKPEKKSMPEHSPVSSLFEKMNMAFSQQIMEQMKLMSNPSLYHYQNYPMDYGGDYFKQYNSIYNNALMGNYLSQLQEYKKPKVKKPNPRTVLKSEIAKETAPPKEEKKPTKTNFNIEDILGKPSTSQAKPQSPNILTPSQLNMSIEDKIKNAFHDLDNPREQTEAINLSPIRKKNLERIREEYEDTSAKRICRGPGYTTEKEGDIEVVVIDD